MSVWSGHTATTKRPLFCCVLHLYIFKLFRLYPDAKLSVENRKNLKID